MAIDRQDRSHRETNGRFNRTSYNPRYPYNQVMKTEGGHEITFDNTPGNERIRIAHKSGSFVETHPNGSISAHTVGNKKSKHKGGVTITVDENNDVKIHGHQRILTGGGSHIETKGNANITVGGNSNSIVMGNQNSAVAGDAYTGVKGNHRMNVSGNMDMKVAGNFTQSVGGSRTETVGGSYTRTSGGESRTKASQIHHN